MTRESGRVLTLQVLGLRMDSDGKCPELAWPVPMPSWVFLALYYINRDKQVDYIYTIGSNREAKCNSI